MLPPAQHYAAQLPWQSNSARRPAHAGKVAPVAAQASGDEGSEARAAEEARAAAEVGAAIEAARLQVEVDELQARREPCRQ